MVRSEFWAHFTKLKPSSSDNFFSRSSGRLPRRVHYACRAWAIPSAHYPTARCIRNFILRVGVFFSANFSLCELVESAVRRFEIVNQWDARICMTNILGYFTEPIVRFGQSPLLRLPGYFFSLFYVWIHKSYVFMYRMLYVDLISQYLCYNHAENRSILTFYEL